MRMYIVFLLAIWTTFSTCSDTKVGAKQESLNVFDALIAKVAALETTTTQLFESVSSLESNNQIQASIIQELRDRLSKAELRVQVLENGADEVFYKVTEKTDHDARPEDTVVMGSDKRNTAVKDGTHGKLPINNEAVNTASVGFERENRIILADGGPVAFFATITTYEVTNLGIGQAIIFDNVVTNLGNAYHPSNGNFVAPYRGLYMFAATIADIGGRVYVYFMLNGNMVCQTATDTNYSASHTIILVLNAGDDVFLSFQGDTGSYVLGAHYSSFAGQLVTTL